MAIARTFSPGNFGQQRAIVLVTLICAWLTWELVAHIGLFTTDVFPSSFRVLKKLFLLLASKEFYVHAVVTVVEFGIAFLIGSLIGILSGMVLGSIRFAGLALEPYISALMATPKIVFFPIALMIFGTGMGSKIALGAFGAFFPVVLNTYVGMLGVNHVHVKVARSFGLSPARIALKIYLPTLLQPIIVGLRIGIGVCITPILLSEIKNSNAGLGYLIIEAYNHFRIEEMYALLVFVFLVVAIINGAMGKVAERITKKGRIRVSASYGGGV